MLGLYRRPFCLQNAGVNTAFRSAMKLLSRGECFSNAFCAVVHCFVIFNPESCPIRE
jgi:hypothetical protein